MPAALQQQIHGYQSGHHLLLGSIKLSRDDQDLVDRLSDMAGPIRPSETFDPYLTLYPLPSEEYFVIARTWQDLDISRAGCVLTRSTFVPMATWERCECILSIVNALTRPTRAERLEALSVSSSPDVFDEVSDPRLPELVEALFLESRQPTVMFGSTEAETINLRLIAALWPSRRRTFASCTWCLGPRKVSGRDFDLVFAPQDARSRFSDWKGRRIELSSKSSQGRHRWTSSLLSSIFVETAPNLTTSDELGILSSDQVGDEGALRLSLMWRDLKEKVETTPNAVLGMLDILNSNSVQREAATTHIESFIINALDIAGTSLPPVEGWKFLFNLLGKFANRIPSPAMLRSLRRASSALARTQPVSAVAALRDLYNQGKPIPPVLAAGMGDGLSYAAMAINVDDIGPREMLCLVAYSRRFSAWLAAVVRDAPSNWTKSVLAAIVTPDPDLAALARRNLLPWLRSPQHAPVLTQLLDDLSPSDLGAAVRTLGKRTKFVVAEFDDAIVAATLGEAAALQVRETVLDFPESIAANRLLGRLVQLTRRDLEWLGTAVTNQRGLGILLDCLKRTDDETVQTLLQDSIAASRILSWLLVDPRGNAELIRRLLQMGHYAVDEFVDASLQIRAYVQLGERIQFDHELLRRTLAESPPSDTALTARVLEDAAQQIGSSEIVPLLTPIQASSQRIMANVAAVAGGAVKIRQAVTSHIDEFTNRLINRGGADFDDDTYAQWAMLIQQSCSVAPQAHLSACIEALAYALRQPQAPISPLVVSAFPTVYKELLRSKGESDLNFVPALLLLPLTFFADWDRAKTARKELIDAFLKSKWPPCDLMLAALDADIDQKILRRLSRSRGGLRYIENIADDTSRLPDHLQRSVRCAIARFTENPRSDEWD